MIRENIYEEWVYISSAGIYMCCKKNGEVVVTGDRGWMECTGVLWLLG